MVLTLKPRSRAFVAPEPPPAAQPPQDLLSPALEARVAHVSHFFGMDTVAAVRMLVLAGLRTYEAEIKRANKACQGAGRGA